jgi:AcrR family transcriptional regulator
VKAAAKKTARRAAPDPSTARSSLTPEAWVEAATEVLVDQGIDHVRVDVLATQLQVTRGSFYWHFRDREDLLRRVLQAWSDRSTALLTARLEAVSSPLEQLRDVISLPFRGRAAQRAARIELAIRAWARRDPMAQAALDASDASRLDYHASIFRALGFDGDEARARAFMTYSYEVSESLLTRQGSPGDKAARRAFMERLAQTPLR